MEEAAPSEPQPLGLWRDRGQRASCGLCGQVCELTRTHVPARVAGNAGDVRRFVPRVASGPARRGRGRKGGVHVHGLCRGCNALQGRYDPAYAVLADGVARQLPPESPLLIPNHVNRLPEMAVQPGAAARSILIGLMALNPNIRAVHPELQEGLLAGADAIALPNDLALRVACYRQPKAYLSGSVGGVLLFHPVRPYDMALGIMSLGSVYFPPLAWHLATRRFSWLDMQRWADVSRWLERDPLERVSLRSLLKGLPEVLHPREDSIAQEAGWVELFSSEITFVVEGDVAS